MRTAAPTRTARPLVVELVTNLRDELVSSLAVTITYEVGIKPGLAVKLSNHVDFITKVGFLGYRGYSPEHGESSSTFGVDVDATNISFGAIYKF